MLAAAEFGFGKGAAVDRLVALGNAALLALLARLSVGVAWAAESHEDKHSTAQNTNPRRLDFCMFYSKATAILPKLLQKAAN